MQTDLFSSRHIGITDQELPHMLATIGVKSIEELIDQTIPTNIRLKKPLQLPAAMTETEFPIGVQGEFTKSISAAKINSTPK